LFKKTLILAALVSFTGFVETTVAQPAPQAQMARGRCFAFAIPQGFRLVEEGQFAVVLAAQDNSAITMVVGNCGYPQGYTPAQFAQEKLGFTGVQNLQIGQARPGRPFQGYQEAYEFDYAYVAGGIPCRGVATVSVRNGYGSTDMVISAAAAHEQRWSQYASWLPQLASQVQATDNSAFGARQMAQQNLQNSVAYGRQLQDYYNHSQQLQQGVTDARWQSDQYQQHHRGEALTGHSYYNDPYGNPAQRLQNGAGVYWVNPQGQVVSSDNSTYDPRTPTDVYWERMTPLGPGE
jgi:hypothetical protein